jgi:putrescine transport system substrate-binding protein
MVLRPSFACALWFFGLVACGRTDRESNTGALPAASGPAVLNIYNWVDEIGPDTVHDFEKRTGIHVNYDVQTSNRILETRLLAGHTDFDIVVPSNNFIQHLTGAGVLLKLDKTRLPNLRNLDPVLLGRVAEFDPGNTYAIPYIWGTNGIGMDTVAVTKALGEPPPRSWRLLFDPKYARRLQRCGIVWMDAEWMMTNFAQLAQGLNPSSERPEDLLAAERLLVASRPYVRYFDNYRGDSDLATGEICIEPASSGSISQAKDVAIQAGRRGDQIEYFIPDEGGMLWFDLLVIPADAPHVDSAYRFLNYMLEPAVIAAVTNATRFANANAAALPLIQPKVRNDALVYPPPEVIKRLHVDLAESAAHSRLETRMWSRIQARQ